MKTRLLVGSLLFTLFPLVLAQEEVRIRVKIFPHLFSYQPQGRDEVINRVELRSADACEIYELDQRTQQKSTRFLARTKKLVLKVERLRVPVFLSCPSDVEIVRGEGLSSFTYRGDFLISAALTKDHAPMIQVVNLVSVENYLMGVVPKEVSPSWPMESLKTQAVAARTYALYHMQLEKKSDRNRLYDVDDSIVYQVYTGTSHRHERSDAAVLATEGQVLTHDGKIIQAYYHADSGGHTADGQKIFAINAPYCKSRRESFLDATAFVKNWETSVSVDEVHQKLRSLGLIAPEESVRELKVPESTSEAMERVMQVTVLLQNGRSFEVPVEGLKNLFSLPSRLFRIERDPSLEVFLVKGRGAGHGVGLNQMGAFFLAAERQWSYEQILNFYYDNVKICVLKDGRCLVGEDAQI